MICRAAAARLTRSAACSSLNGRSTCADDGPGQQQLRRSGCSLPCRPYRADPGCLLPPFTAPQASRRAPTASRRTLPGREGRGIPGLGTHPFLDRLPPRERHAAHLRESLCAGPHAAAPAAAAREPAEGPKRAARADFRPAAAGRCHGRQQLPPPPLPDDEPFCRGVAQHHGSVERRKGE